LWKGFFSLPAFLPVGPIGMLYYYNYRWCIIYDYKCWYCTFILSDWARRIFPLIFYT
jgi:hypothetical protein